MTPLLKAASRSPSRAVRELLADRQTLAVVAPHPDDETLGCGAFIHDAAASGAECVVVCLTDGSASHRGSPSWPPRRIGEVRRSELTAALGELAASARIVWLGYADCGLPSADDAAACARLSGALPEGALVAAAWGGDPHVDHACGAALVARVARDRPDLKVVWYPIWGRFAETADLPRLFSLVASLEALAAKRRALACHATQMTRLIDDDPDGFVMDAATQLHFLDHPEIFLAD